MWFQKIMKSNDLVRFRIWLPSIWCIWFIFLVVSIFVVVPVILETLNMKRKAPNQVFAVSLKYCYFGCDNIFFAVATWCGLCLCRKGYSQECCENTGIQIPVGWNHPWLLNLHASVSFWQMPFCDICSMRVFDSVQISAREHLQSSWEKFIWY